jgi:hypothetical protein
MEKNAKKLLGATATPLASIFGSGFLVIVPILYGAVGPYSVVAMACVCGLAYAVGSVIRYNIRYAEPLLEAGKASDRAVFFEHTADIALVMAYAISVCLYIRILAAFLLGGLKMDTPINEQIVSVVVIGSIGLVGYIKGLDMLQELEDLALVVTLLIIVALLAAFGSYDFHTFTGATIELPAMPNHSWWEIATIVGGTLIVVQGFEAVYLVFVALATPLMHFLGGKVEDNGLIILAAKASSLLTFPLVAAAVLSQFSAAVADTIAGGGNLAETTKGHVDSRHGYVLICGIGVVLAFFNTLTILALASRAFAFYYALQCLVAINVSQKPLEKLAMRLLAAVLIFIAVFSVPAG